jgi:hypothetical protein
LTQNKPDQRFAIGMIGSFRRHRHNHAVDALEPAGRLLFCPS